MSYKVTNKGKAGNNSYNKLGIRIKEYKELKAGVYLSKVMDVQNYLDCPDKILINYECYDFQGYKYFLKKYSIAHIIICVGEIMLRIYYLIFC